MKYWLLKSEPDAWSWNNQVKEGASMWDGVRNYQARNNLKEMKKNDLCFFYHSVTERSIVGIVKVVKEFYPDPTDKTGRFVVVDVKATRKLKNPVSLDQIKENSRLQDIALVKQSRLSVMPITKSEWKEILKISKKEALLKASENKVRLGGYSNFSFRELACEVGIKSASVHYHFATKADLGAELAHQYTNSFLAALGEPSELKASGKNPIDVYNQLMDELVGFNKDLLDKDRLIVRTKIDTASEDVDERWSSFPEEFIDISSVSNQGLNTLKDKLVSFLSAS